MLSRYRRKNHECILREIPGIVRTARRITDPVEVCLAVNRTAGLIVTVRGGEENYFTTENKDRLRYCRNQFDGTRESPGNVASINFKESENRKIHTRRTRIHGCQTWGRMEKRLLFSGRNKGRMKHCGGSAFSLYKGIPKTEK